MVWCQKHCVAALGGKATILNSVRLVGVRLHQAVPRVSDARRSPATAGTAILYVVYGSTRSPISSSRVCVRPSRFYPRPLWIRTPPIVFGSSAAAGLGRVSAGFLLLWVVSCFKACWRNSRARKQTPAVLRHPGLTNWNTRRRSHGQLLGAGANRGSRGDCLTRTLIDPVLGVAVEAYGLGPLLQYQPNAGTALRRAGRSARGPKPTDIRCECVFGWVSLWKGQL